MVAARQDRMYSGETLTGCSDARQRQVRSSLTGGRSLTSIETGTALPGTSTKCDAREIHKRKILAGTRRGRSSHDAARQWWSNARRWTLRSAFAERWPSEEPPRCLDRYLGPNPETEVCHGRHCEYWVRSASPPLPVFGQSGYFRGRFRPTRDQAPPLSNSRHPSGEAGMRKLGERPGCPSSTLYWLKSGGGLLV